MSISNNLNQNYQTQYFIIIKSYVNFYQKIKINRKGLFKIFIYIQLDFHMLAQNSHFISNQPKSLDDLSYCYLSHLKRKMNSFSMNISRSQFHQKLYSRGRKKNHASYSFQLLKTNTHF